MKYTLVAEKRYKCAKCKKSILKGQIMIVERIGHMKPARWHIGCYSK